MWRKTYDFYYTIGNNFAKSKWFSYTNKYCYYNVSKDGDAYDDEIERFKGVKKATEKKQSKRRMQTVKPKAEPKKDAKVEPKKDAKVEPKKDAKTEPTKPAEKPKADDKKDSSKVPAAPEDNKQKEARLTAIDTYWRFVEDDKEGVDFQKTY